MFAMSRAATALVIKRRYPTASLRPLLLAVRAVELLWVIFTYSGIEHVAVTGAVIHHPAVLTTIILAQIVLSWLLVWWRAGRGPVAARAVTHRHVAYRSH